MQGEAEAPKLRVPFRATTPSPLREDERIFGGHVERGHVLQENLWVSGAVMRQRRRQNP